MGKIQIEQLRVGRQVTLLLLCLKDLIMLCHVSIYSKTSVNIFLNIKNTVLNGEQEKESINRVRMG